MYTVEASRSEDCDVRERADWWRDRVTMLQSPMTIQVRDGFRGRFEYQRSDAYQVVRWCSEAERLERSARDVRLHPDGNVELFVPGRGAIALYQDGLASTVRPGQMLLACLDQPFELRHGDGLSAVGFRISTERLDSRLPQWRTASKLLEANSGLGRIALDLIMSVHRQSDELTGSQFNAISDRIVDLLALCWTADTACDSQDVQNGLLAEIRRFVRENAHDPELTGAGIASRLGWSLRHIQVQLQRAGTTPSDLIREERLSLARLRLQDPAWSAKSVTQIAYASGFGDLSTFSNAYRRTFGERPSDSRATSTPGQS